MNANDVVGSLRYMDANGDMSVGTIINLKNVNFGGLDLNNVRASVVRNQKAPLLLGQSVLGKVIVTLAITIAFYFLAQS